MFTQCSDNWKLHTALFHFLELASSSKLAMVFIIKLITTERLNSS